MVHFVGAGPGAPDLITVRGKQYLEEADVVIYAGSLVNPKLLEYTKDICTIYNSAKMTLEEVIHVIEKAEAAVDQEAAQEMSKKLKKMDFDFNDYLTSMEQMNKMGGMSDFIPEIHVFSVRSVSRWIFWMRKILLMITVRVSVHSAVLQVP